jgi:Sulfatase-modifying factor enzyme 1
MRGGSWNNNAENCRVSNRNNNNPDNRNNNIGFRVASSPSSIEGRMASTEQAFVRFLRSIMVWRTKNPCFGVWNQAAA